MQTRWPCSASPPKLPQLTFSPHSTLPRPPSLSWSPTTNTPLFHSTFQHHFLKYDSSHPIVRPLWATMADKLRTLQQLESLQAKHVGTGHADTTRHEWTNNIVRDSYASYIGHPPLVAYMALGMGEPKEKVRGQLIEKMVRGVGAPPEREE